MRLRGVREDVEDHAVEDAEHELELGPVNGTRCLALEDLETALAEVQGRGEERLREDLLLVEELEVVVVDLSVDLVRDELAGVVAMHQSDVLVRVLIVVEVLHLRSPGRRDGLVAGLAHCGGGLVGCWRIAGTFGVVLLQLVQEVREHLEEVTLLR